MLLPDVRLLEELRATLEGRVTELALRCVGTSELLRVLRAAELLRVVARVPLDAVRLARYAGAGLAVEAVAVPPTLPRGSALAPWLEMPLSRPPMSNALLGPKWW